ncbi:MAG: hypothetical protein WDW38_010115 [Sanguina aurantia]
MSSVPQVSFFPSGHCKTLLCSQFAVDDYYSLLQRHERVEGGHAVVEPFNNSTGEEFNTSSSDSDQSTDQEPPAPPNDQALLSLALREHYLRRAGGSGGGGACSTDRATRRSSAYMEHTRGAPDSVRTGRRHTLRESSPVQTPTQQSSQTPSRAFLRTWQQMQAGGCGTSNPPNSTPLTLQSRAGQTPSSFNPTP